VLEARVENILPREHPAHPQFLQRVYTSILIGVGYCWNVPLDVRDALAPTSEPWSDCPITQGKGTSR
jgi:hypothetical protein